MYVRGNEEAERLTRRRGKSIMNFRTHRSKSVSLDESLKPLANGLLSIFSLVICKFKRKPVNYAFYVGTTLREKND